MKILVTGSTGLIGKELVQHLVSKEYDIVQLSRRTALNEAGIYHWNIETGKIDIKSLENIDHIIHLAGANLSEKRWSSSRKKEIQSSRINSTRLLFNLVKKLNRKPKSIISASAVGYYGSKTVEKIFSEDDPPSNDFVGNTCRHWEEEVLKFESLGVNTIRLRFGVVLSKNGGALKKMLPIAKLGLGSAIGTGQQYIPWIHIEDVIRAVEWFMHREMKKEVFNLCSNHFVRFEEFSKELSAVLDKPYFLPNVPSFLVQLVFGEMSQILLEGSRVSPQKLINSGFEFKHSDLKISLEDLLIT